MDDSKHSAGEHRSTASTVDLLRRYHRAILLRAVYGAATATGTTAVGLIAVVVQRHL